MFSPVGCTNTVDLLRYLPPLLVLCIQGEGLGGLKRIQCVLLPLDPSPLAPSSSPSLPRNPPNPPLSLPPPALTTNSPLASRQKPHHWPALVTLVASSHLLMAPEHTRVAWHGPGPKHFYLNPAGRMHWTLPAEPFCCTIEEISRTGFTMKQNEGPATCDEECEFGLRLVVSNFFSIACRKTHKMKRLCF